MGTRLTQIPFDIETSGFDTDASVTVIGFTLPLGCRVFLNTAGRSAVAQRLETGLNDQFEAEIRVSTHQCELDVLDAVATFLGDTIASREYLLVAYNGERFNGGFDLPFLRTRYALNGLEWPFDSIPYADILPIIQNRFNTRADGEDRNDLVQAYDTLIGGDLSRRDPFEESSEAVDAFESGAFDTLLAHNIADILRTDALAALTERYCAKSEFNLKSLTPSIRDPDLN